MVVDDATVIRIEWWHFGGLTTVNDSFCKMFSLFDEVLFLNFAMMINIDTDTGSFPVLALHDPIYQILDIIEPFASATDQQIRFTSKDLYRGSVS